MRDLSFQFPVDSVEFKIIKDAFFVGSEKYTPTPSVAFFTLKMCHSLPAINSKGRCFSYKTLVKSLHSIPHNLVDYSHHMEDSGAEKDEIIGHIISVKLAEVADKNVAVPNEPAAVTIFGALYKRVAKAQDIIATYENKGTLVYRSSMECLYDPEETAFYHDGKFIPIKSASKEMKSCLSSDKVDDYDGKAMGYALGGEDGEVIFIGDAFTLYPADKEAKLETLYASVAGDGAIRIGDQRLSHKTGRTAMADKTLKIEIQSDKSAKGTTVKIDGNDVAGMQSFNFSVYSPDQWDKEGRVFCSYSVIDETDDGFKSTKSFSLSDAIKGDFVEIDMAAIWTTKYINTLPNSSFAVVEPDYTTGKNTNKNCRHIPYKDAAGKVDIPHLRNALVRMNQIQAITKSITTAELRTKAKAKLTAVAKRLLKDTKFNDVSSIGLAEMTIEQITKTIKEISKYTEEVKTMEIKDLKLPESITVAMKNADLDADNSKVVGEIILAEMKKVAEVSATDKETEVKETYKTHKSADEVATAIAADRVEQKALAEKSSAREKVIKDAGVEMTEYRKTQVAKFGFDEPGIKEFDAWIADIKIGVKPASAAAGAVAPAAGAPALQQAVASTGDGKFVGGF